MRESILKGFGEGRRLPSTLSVYESLSLARRCVFSWCCFYFYLRTSLTPTLEFEVRIDFFHAE